MAVNWGAFNPNNLKGKYLDQLRNDVYRGFATRTHTIQGRRRKGGRGPSTTKQVFDASYYKNHTGWKGIGDKLGININSQNDVRQMFDYVNGYKPPAAAAPQAAATAAAAAPAQTPTNKYQSQIAALTASIAAQQQQFSAAQAATQQASQANYQSQLSKMQGLYAGNLQSTKNQFGLQIKGLQTGYGKQIAGLQSSVSGLQTTISDNAAAYQQNIADQAAQFKTEQQTMITNQERARQAGASPQLRLQEAQDMKQAGTKNFKKRSGSQFNPSAYGSLASIKSGTLNI